MISQQQTASTLMGSAPGNHGAIPLYPTGATAIVPVPPTYELIPNRTFVGGFPAGTTETELRNHFQQFFPVRDVKLIKKVDGTSKGYGFVTFENEDDAEAVRKLNAKKLEFKSRSLNLGPALRKIPNTFFPVGYTMATTQGQLISPMMAPYGLPYSANTNQTVTVFPSPVTTAYPSPNSVTMEASPATTSPSCEKTGQHFFQTVGQPSQNTKYLTEGSLGNEQQMYRSYACAVANGPVNGESEVAHAHMHNSQSATRSNSQLSPDVNMNQMYGDNCSNPVTPLTIQAGPGYNYPLNYQHFDSPPSSIMSQAQVHPNYNYGEQATRQVAYVQPTNMTVPAYSQGNIAHINPQHFVTDNGYGQMQQYYAQHNFFMSPGQQFSYLPYHAAAFTNEAPLLDYSVAYAGTDVKLDNFRDGNYYDAQQHVQQNQMYGERFNSHVYRNQYSTYRGRGGKRRWEENHRGQYHRHRKTSGFNASDANQNFSRESSTEKLKNKSRGSVNELTENFKDVSITGKLSKDYDEKLEH